MSSSKIANLSGEIKQLVDQSHKILLHLHPRADGDSVGSALGSYHVLKAMGKEVTVIRGDTAIPNYLAHLPGVEEIVPKTFFEIDLTQFDLFIIQDASAPGYISTLGEIAFPPHLKVVNIDHHASNEGYVPLSLVDSSYASTAEMLVELYEGWGVTFTHDAALCFFIGMYTDTGGFRYSATTSQTFSYAAKLVAIAPDFHKVLFEMDNHNTKERLFYEGLALLAAKTYSKNKIGISAVSYAQLQENAISREDAKSEISNKLKSVTGWEIGISLVEEAPKEVKISTRSRDGEKYDVSKIVVKLGGGGHKAAAGVLLKTSLEDALKQVLEATTSIYPDLA